MDLSAEQLLRDSRYSQYFCKCDLSSSDLELINYYISCLVPVLSPKRLRHTILAALTTLKLKFQYSIEVESIRLIEAAMLHDCAREMPVAEIVNLACQNINSNIPKGQRVALLHGRAGAAVASSRFNIVDEMVLEAIKYHTTGLARGGIVLGLLIVADYLEPGRIFHGEAPVVDDYSCFKHLLVEILSRKIKWVLVHRKWLSPITLDCYNSLIEEISAEPEA